ncbi:cobaltochelatase CobT-related protein [Tepidibacter hydrothermalis]|uniref:Nitric oxide reductase activation-like protein n=1 Tax=Tepidibacter hydrothermalis TaxID=3036126 RepID=A0ABY8EGW4_9FIRM|nr:nitric oxide reductase activation-like protein [Tepidibacter hydrothermalis]WFD12187.1 nitric oxide reductase activation-like protein [Tepidibacter hydrothermalis]
MYNDFDFENRLKNIIWTICGNYDQNLESFEEFSNKSKNISIYYAAKLGARRKYIDWDMIRGYINHKLKNGVEKDTIIPLVEICSDIMVEENLLTERPGIYDIRKTGLEEIFENYFEVNAKTFIEKLKYALVLEQIGKYGNVDIKVRNILQEMKICKNSKDTLELLKNIEVLYNTYFDQDLSDIEFVYEQEIVNETRKIDIEKLNENFSSFMYEELYEDEDVNISNEIDKMSSSLLIQSIGDFKNNRDLKLEDNTVISIDDSSLEKIYERIEYYYGKSFISKEELKYIQNKICKNVHIGSRIHFTDGVLRSSCDNSFQIKYVTKHKEKNMSVFRENIKIYRRNITRLKDILTKTLVAEKEISRVYSYSGSLDANKLWRIGRSNNTKVFTKVEDNEKGGYVVDILLDASGSQSSRQGKVATQGYIISEALTRSGIPNRVMSFCSFLDNTIIRRYRNYDCPISENNNIFEYYASGNNRDGLAIKAVSEGLLNRNEENKILIILSDGRPNDINIKKNNSIRPAYKGRAAVMDTAFEVRNCRKNGILVLGVFTGKEEDLNAEKLIYGKDFVYTRNIERFSDIVGAYLKKIIKN